MRNPATWEELAQVPSIARGIGKVWLVAQVVEYGIVGVNSGTIPTDVAPFGTVKESGLPREGSKYRIEDHLGMKCFCMVGIS